MLVHIHQARTPRETLHQPQMVLQAIRMCWILSEGRRRSWLSTTSKYNGSNTSAHYYNQGRTIHIGYCIVFTILASIGFTQYLLYFPNTIQYNIFLKKKVGEDRNNCRKEEEDKVKWMRRMRKDRFFRKCRKRSGEEEEDEVWKMRRMRMRKDRFSLRYNPSDLILGQNTQGGVPE